MVYFIMICPHSWWLYWQYDTRLGREPTLKEEEVASESKPQINFFINSRTTFGSVDLHRVKLLFEE